jgi:small subunit ribosomal protein S1
MYEKIFKMHPKLDLKIGEIIEGEIIEKRVGAVYVDLGIFGVGKIYGAEYINNRNLIKNFNIGEKIKVKVIGMDEDGFLELSLSGVRNLIGWNKVKEAFEKREILELEVKDANNGGLIVDFFSIKGFVPVSQLMPEYYPRVGENEKNKIVQRLKNLVGKTFRFRIIDYDPEKEKLILSQKAAEEETIQNYLLQFKPGQIVEGKITGISRFGIFFRIKETPIEGLIHISEIPAEKKEKLEVGMETKAKILRIENDRIFFSLKFEENQL